MTYTCPMHPEIRQDKPGRCPKCGMDLVPEENKPKEEAEHPVQHTVHHAASTSKSTENHKVHTTHDVHAKHETHDAHDSHANHKMPDSHDPHAQHAMHRKHGSQGNHDIHSMHDKHAGHHTANFLQRFWICLIVTIPILLLSHMIQEMLGFSFRFPGDKYVLLALSTFVYFYGGMPFLKGMVAEIKHNAIGMMTLVALAITVAYLYSAAVVAGVPGMDFFWELATLIDIMLLGHWLEMKSEMAASKALKSIVALLPATAHVERNGVVTDIPLSELKKDDHIRIKPGEKIPADGTVLDGSSSVNESMLTGESVPVLKEKDAKVIAGSLNENGTLKVLVTGAGEESYLSKVIEMVQSAQAAKSNTQNLADKVAKWLTYISIVAGVLTFIYWYSTGNNFSFALERLVTVMVTSCPHALGVAIPLVVAISTSKAAVSGLLIRNRTSFENSRKITTLLFDKTGTLTKGSHELKQIIPLNNTYNADELLQLAAAAQQHSEHFIAKGILRKLQEKNIPLLPSSNFEYMQGMGVNAVVNGKPITVGGPNYFAFKKWDLPETPGSIDEKSETINYILIDGKPEGVITFSDTLRDTSAEAISTLKKMDIKSYLLTGDNEHIAASVSDKLKMDGFRANVLPHQKLEVVKSFQKEGEFVGMTGDGVNDAPALAQADVGIAVGSGTDVAAETADIILVNSDPNDVVKMISFGRKTYRKMIQNLGWAVGYNVIAIPLAAGVLYPHFVLSPAMGAILMSLSTIIVAFNAQLLRNETP